MHVSATAATLRSEIICSAVGPSAASGFAEESGHVDCLFKENHPRRFKLSDQSMSSTSTKFIPM
jgi:hypothetical protein